MMRAVMVVLAGLWAGRAAAATATSIAAITDAPAAFAGQSVTVVGTVTAQRYSYAGESLYTISGDNRRISVLSHEPAPALGDRIELDATVGYRAPDEEFTWPPLLEETARRPAP
jgi:hypothetical protein